VFSLLYEEYRHTSARFKLDVYQYSSSFEKKIKKLFPPKIKPLIPFYLKESVQWAARKDYHRP